jgi:hypothetical protein
LGFQIISNRFWEVMQPQNTTAIRVCIGYWSSTNCCCFVVLIVSYIVQTILDSPNAIGL